MNATFDSRLVTQNNLNANSPKTNLRLNIGGSVIGTEI
jgi:hypothetical protein